MSDNDQIETWLDGIGLAQYATAFAENAIDLEVLPDVTEADLEKLGNLAHRAGRRAAAGGTIQPI